MPRYPSTQRDTSTTAIRAPRTGEVRTNEPPGFSHLVQSRGSRSSSRRPPTSCESAWRSLPAPHPSVLPGRPCSAPRRATREAWHERLPAHVLTPVLASGAGLGGVLRGAGGGLQVSVGSLIQPRCRLAHGGNVYGPSMKTKPPAVRAAAASSSPAGCMDYEGNVGPPVTLECDECEAEYEIFNQTEHGFDALHRNPAAPKPGLKS